MDYKKHTKERYLERFKSELTDDDYTELCNICKSDNVILQVRQNRLNKNRNRKNLILFRNKYTWCVLSKRGKIKTVFPAKRKEIKKIAQ